MSSRPGPSFKLVLKLILALTILGVADLLLTWKLITHGDGQVIESNPVAAWWLATYGWGGMTAFKLGMTLVVACLAGSIACWRPRTGELILVFACGTQSAVVLYSVFLARLIDKQEAMLMPEVLWLPPGSPGPDMRGGSQGFYSPGLLPENGLLLLLAHESVQQELGCSEAQVKTIKQLGGKRMEMRMNYRRWDREEWNSGVQQLLAQEKALTDDLEPEQAERLQQIAWQQRGPFVFTEPEVSEALQLTADQKEKVRALMEGVRRTRPTFPRPWGYVSEEARRVEDDLNRIKSQLWAVLTPEQMAKWNELIGEPFKGDLRPRFGPGPMPGPMPGPGRPPGRGPRS